MGFPQLLGPGGSFDSAFYALNMGADAVYIGLKEFSARASASNFTFDDLRKLKSYSIKTNKKIYVALNTIIKENEWNKIREILFELMLINIDGLILHDLGLISFIKTHFPEFRLHGSTQLAAHNHASVHFLKKQGLSRLVLPREMSLVEIKNLIQEHKDMEFEVFIHGALCYGFSGTCLASGWLLGRSGNRGSCGQVCRTWFHGPKGKGYYFSSKDLSLGMDIHKLVQAGVHALKIEGRMKSPEYAGTASAYYRHCLDQKNPHEIEKYEEQLKLLFSRKASKGFLFSNTNKINRKYPSHIGIELGQVLDTKPGKFKIKLKASIGLRDGLMYLKSSEIDEPVKWAIKEIHQEQKRQNFMSSGQEVWLNSNDKIPKSSIIYKISAHNLNWKTNRQKEFQAYKTRFQLTIALESEQINLKAQFQKIENFIPDFEFSFPIQAQKAKKTSDIHGVLEKLFHQSDQVLYVPESINIINKSQFPNKEIFFPPKDLKAGRKSFYTKLEEFTHLKKQDYLNQSHKYEGTKRKSLIIENLPNKKLNLLFSEIFAKVSRKDLSPNNKLPFITSAQDLNLHTLKTREDWIILPITPLSLCSDLNEKKLLEFLNANKNSKFLVGLNHYHHIESFQQIFQLPNCYFFIDFLLFAANSYTMELFYQKIPRLLWIYYWLEHRTSDIKELFAPNIPWNLKIIESDFNPSLFISRFCFSTNSLDMKCCQGQFSEKIHKLKQQKNEFELIEKQGINYFLQPDNQSSDSFLK